MGGQHRFNNYTVSCAVTTGGEVFCRSRNLYSRLRLVEILNDDVSLVTETVHFVGRFCLILSAHSFLDRFRLGHAFLREISSRCPHYVSCLFSSCSSLDKCGRDDD